jgi:hypothetical protein
MNANGERTKRIMELLKREYQSGGGPGPEIGPAWQERAMAHIRESSRLPSAGLVTLMGQLSWRLVPATVSLAVMLAILVVRTHLAIDYNPLQLLITHAEDLMLTRLLGV